jgi:hypothetical protein
LASAWRLVARSLLVGLAHAFGSASSSSSARSAASAFSTSRSNSRLMAFLDGPAGLARPLPFAFAALASGFGGGRAPP